MTHLGVPKERKYGKKVFKNMQSIFKIPSSKCHM